MLTLSCIAGIIVDFIPLDLSPLGFLASVEKDCKQAGPSQNKPQTDIFGDAEEEGFDHIAEAEPGIA